MALSTKYWKIGEIIQYTQGLRTTAVGGIFFPGDAHLIPDQFVRQLARHIENKGVQLLNSVEVLGFETSGRKVTTVKTTRGDISVEEVILAGGSWSTEIARELKIEVLMEPAKGYSVTYKRPPGFPSVPVGHGRGESCPDPHVRHGAFRGHPRTCRIRHVD